MILNVAVMLHRGGSLVLMVAVGVHVDLVDAVVIGWIVGELEEASAEWRSHHIVGGVTVALGIQPPDFEGSEVAIEELWNL